MNEALQANEDPGKWAAAALAFCVHILLVVFLFYGIRWQSHAPAVVEVELVRALPPTQAVTPPPPVQEPSPPPKVEPKPVPPPPKKPEIAIKEKKKPKPKEVKPEPKETKPKPAKEIPNLKEALDEEFKRLDKEKADRELDDLLKKKSEAEAILKANRGRATWTDKIVNKVRGNVILPLNIVGNPDALFEITQLPSGEIIDVKLKKSSGNASLDAAAERAIRKSSPLPKQETGDPFVRSFLLRYTPYEE